MVLEFIIGFLVDQLKLIDQLISALARLSGVLREANLNGRTFNRVSDVIWDRGNQGQSLIIALTHCHCKTVAYNSVHARARINLRNFSCCSYDVDSHIGGVDACH